MRRSIVLSTVLAASVAVLGACEPKVDAPKPTPATPVPSATSSPVPSPTTSPTGSPAKPGASPEVKKADGGNVNKDAKVPPAATPKAK